MKRILLKWHLYKFCFLILSFIGILSSCNSSGPVVKITTITDNQIQDLNKEYIEKIKEIKKSRSEYENTGLNEVIETTPNMTVNEYMKRHPNALPSELSDYKVGGYDVLSITVYEEPDLSREQVRVAADGYISFPLVGRIYVEDLSTAEIENLISSKLAEGQYLFDAHVSVIVTDYKSKQFLVLGSVNQPGTYPLKAKERLLDALSKAKGIDFEQGGKQAMIIRT